LSIDNTSSPVGEVLQRASIEVPGITRPRPFHPFRSAARSFAGFVFSAAVLSSLIGCGNTYRPVVTAINPVGPAGQPQKYAVAVASSPNGTPGLMTLVDFSGDTILVTPNVGVNPYYLAVDTGGTTGYTLNGDGTLTSFDISPSLMTNQVLQTTLLPGANPASLFASASNAYIAEPGRNAVALLKGSPPALQQELPVAANPVYVAGLGGAARYYVISQGTGAANGVATAVETSTNTLSNAITVGKSPVYGVISTDGKRAFIQNKGDGTVSVINVQTNQLDTFHDPTDPTGIRITSTIPVGPSPVWADLVSSRAELVVANAGNGTSAGSLSIINTPLCSVAAQNNPNCDPTNPIDATGFGQVLATVPVGHSPIMVSVLQDGTRAYVANFADSTVSVVNLTTNTVTATIPVVGRPIYIAATQGTPTGKVYVVSADTVAPNKNSVMTVIRTDTDTVTTTINLQGTGVSVRVTQP
jgi:YVTN family beta-propeller protein